MKQKQDVIERFEKELSFLINELYEINSYKLLYEHLYNKKNNPKFLSAMNKAPAFFGLTIHSYQHMFIMGLSKLCEERNLKGNNIFSFLKFLETHHSTIFPNNSNKQGQQTHEKAIVVSPKLYETEMDITIEKHRPKIDMALIEKHKTQLKDFNDKCIKPLMKWRDKSFAHNDKKYIGQNIEKMGEDFPILYGDIGKLISLIGDILNTYQVAYNNTSTDLIPTNTYDVDIVLQALLHQQ